jgi:hypothetical protein
MVVGLLRRRLSRGDLDPVRPVSLSFRLYGNVFAGETMLETMARMPHIGWLVQIPFYFLELMVGLVQALVFMLLTAVFTLLMCQPHERPTPAGTTSGTIAASGIKGERTWSAVCTWRSRQLGAALAVGWIGAAASAAVGRNPGSSTQVLVQSILAIAFAEAIVFYTLFLVR